MLAPCSVVWSNLQIFCLHAAIKELLPLTSRSAAVFSLVPRALVPFASDPSIPVSQSSPNITARPLCSGPGSSAPPLSWALKARLPHSSPVSHVCRSRCAERQARTSPLPPQAQHCCFGSEQGWAWREGSMQRANSQPSREEPPCLEW